MTVNQIFFLDMFSNLGIQKPVKPSPFPQLLLFRWRLQSVLKSVHGAAAFARSSGAVVSRTAVTLAYASLCVRRASAPTSTFVATEARRRSFVFDSVRHNCSTANMVSNAAALANTLGVPQAARMVANTKRKNLRANRTGPVRAMAEDDESPSSAPGTRRPTQEAH